MCPSVQIFLDHREQCGADDRRGVCAGHPAAVQRLAPRRHQTQARHHQEGPPQRPQEHHQSQ